MNKAWQILPARVMFLVFLAAGAVHSQPAAGSFNTQDPCTTAIGRISVDLCQNRFTFPASVNMAKGLIEVVLCNPSGKTHESLFTCDIDPVTFETALLLIGANRTEPYSVHARNPEMIAGLKHKKKKPDLLTVWVEYRLHDSICRERIDSFIFDMEKKTVMEQARWHFKGIPVNPRDEPFPFSGNNLIVSFIERDAILELDSPRLFVDNFFFAWEEKLGPLGKQEVTIIVELAK